MTRTSADQITIVLSERSDESDMVVVWMEFCCLEAYVLVVVMEVLGDVAK